MSEDRLNLGTIHGRFQPFHVGHLQMARQAFSHCGNLIVGITNPDPEATTEESEDTQRHRPEANPFSYWERSLMITRALVRADIPRQSFCTAPFSINKMDSWPWEFYMPGDAIWYLRVKGDWGKRKAKRLRKHGLEVRELPFERYTDVSGTEIRRRMRQGGNWEKDLPAGTIETIDRLNLLEHFS